MLIKKGQRERVKEAREEGRGDASKEWEVVTGGGGTVDMRIHDI